MALINCTECGRQISDKAMTCPGCGAPVAQSAVQLASAETEKSPQINMPACYESDSGRFLGTMESVTKLAMRAVQDLGWKLDEANGKLGFVTFQTRMSWGSFNGVSGSLNIEETTPGRFRVTGAGKQNAQGHAIVLNLFGEAQGKADKAIDRMRSLAETASRFKP